MQEFRRSYRMGIDQEPKEKEQPRTPIQLLQSQLKDLKEASMELSEHFQEASPIYKARISELNCNLRSLLEREEKMRLFQSSQAEEQSVEHLEARAMDLCDLYSSIDHVLENLEGKHMTLKAKKQLRAFYEQFNAVAGTQTVLEMCISPLQLREWRGQRHLVKPVPESLTFDPHSAHPNLIVSSDLKQVRFQPSPTGKKSRECFDPGLYVLALPGFQSGRHYWEVDVGSRSSWIIGVVRESVERKVGHQLYPVNGYWALRKQQDGIYYGLEVSPIHLNLNFSPTRIGVCLDFFRGALGFFDADTTILIFELPCTSGEKLLPFFCPGIPVKEEDWCPLILCG
ncbi:hypothetical protein XENTR_v10003621 [Xenopus tropicalis]|uniref:Novel protein containing SPRY domain isoform X1 n=2 Tax=Xenopus tropicalis TaxID=8364 RepID=A0A803J9T3_XENTR|nr:novel protein containing SPRY domain isoform X1 [Xenopus tropicalis]KAE8574886.1 hypothetical protein XENTR_v10003621 [Xenopus tropicalis]